MQQDLNLINTVYFNESYFEINVITLHYYSSEHWPNFLMSPYPLYHWAKKFKYSSTWSCVSLPQLWVTENLCYFWNLSPNIYQCSRLGTYLIFNNWLYRMSTVVNISVLRVFRVLSRNWAVVGGLGTKTSIFILQPRFYTQNTQVFHVFSNCCGGRSVRVLGAAA